MKIVFDYIRLTLFLGAALIGVQIPSFVHLYGVQLSARLSESALSLSEFQHDADAFFEGDIQELARHYQNKPDPIINKGGDNIATLFSRNARLKEAHANFTQGDMQQYWHVFSEPLADIKHDTWQQYDYSIKLNINGILWALSLGLLLSLLIESTLRFLSLISHKLFKRSPKTLAQSD